MKPVAEKLAMELENVRFNAPDFPVFSNTTGTPYPSEAPAIRNLLAGHIQKPLDFIAQIENVHAEGAYYFIEVGPGKILSGLVNRILEGKPHQILALDNPGRAGTAQAAHFIARLHACGLPVDLSSWFSPGLRRQKPWKRYAGMPRTSAIPRR